MKTFFKAVAHMVIFLLPLLFLSGIAMGQSDSAPVRIVIFRGGVNIDAATDPIIQEIDRRLGVEIVFKTADWSEIGQVRNLDLGAGEDIDIYHHMDLNPQWINDEVIIPLDDYITPENHPYLTAITSSPTFSPLKRDGHIYYIPMISHGWDWIFAVRKDWMDELGLDMPANEVEFRDMLQAFKDKDPDGRTVGWQIEGAAQVRRSILPILTAFGVPTSFYDPERSFTIDDEGMLHPVIVSDNMKAAMQYLNELYNAGLINTDFPSMSSMPMLNERYLQAGKAGVSWVQNPTNLQMAEENVEWAYIPPFSATGYEQTRALGLANNGYIAVSATSENPQKAVDVLEFLNSEEGRQLIVAGIQGVHYNTFDAEGNFDRNQEAWSASYDTPTYPLYFYFGQGLMHGYIPVDKYDTFEEAMDHTVVFEPSPNPTGLRQVIQESSQWVGASNPFQFVDMASLSDLLTEMNDAIITGWTKVISADPGTFKSAWDEYLAEWGRVGGNEWVAAFQTYYDENLR